MNLTKYFKLSKEAKLEYVSSLNGIEKLFHIYSDNNTPILKHIETGLEFVYIPRGEFNRGFSCQEEYCAENIEESVQANYSEMRPVEKVFVQEFLVTRYPITNKFVNRYISLSYYSGEEMYPAFSLVMNIH